MAIPETLNAEQAQSSLGLVLATARRLFPDKTFGAQDIADATGLTVQRVRTILTRLCGYNHLRAIGEDLNQFRVSQEQHSTRQLTAEERANLDAGRPSSGRQTEAGGIYSAAFTTLPTPPKTEERIVQVPEQIPEAPAPKPPIGWVLRGREPEIYALFAAGKRDKEIGELFGVTAGTIYHHRRNWHKVKSTAAPETAPAPQLAPEPEETLLAPESAPAPEPPAEVTPTLAMDQAEQIHLEPVDPAVGTGEFLTVSMGRALPEIGSESIHTELRITEARSVHLCDDCRHARVCARKRGFEAWVQTWDRPDLEGARVEVGVTQCEEFLDEEGA